MEENRWEQMRAKAAALADEAIAKPDLLMDELDWLFSDEAEHAFAFFRRLGELDKSLAWLPTMIERVREGSGAHLLAAYLQGRADAGERKWVEETLDTWTEEEPDLAEAILEITWRGPASTRGVDRLLALVDKEWLEPRYLGVSALGGWAADLPYDDFHAVLSRLTQDEGPQATEAALIMLVSRLEKHPVEEEALIDVIWSLVKRSVAIAQRGTIDLHYWEWLAKRSLSQDAAGLAKLILDNFAESGRVFTLNDSRGDILLEATRADPVNVWEEVSKRLLRDDDFAFRLRLALENIYVTQIDTDYLIQWATQHIPEGPRLLSELAPVGGTPLWSLARELLVRYGDDEAIKSNLGATYLSGGWVGPMSAWLESKLDIATTWLQNPHPRVREWASEVAQHLEREIRDAKLREEEWGIYG